METQQPIYDLPQIVFSLCTVSNISALFNHSHMIKERTPPALKAILADGEIQNYIGKWEVVWGPYVDVPILSNVAGNSMYIAYSKDIDTYVVAIAGTDGPSIGEWLLEDFHIDSKVAWPYNDAPDRGAISDGANRGLNKLIEMGDWFWEKTALEYLKHVKAKNIIVTGHSLGGTLTPLFALFVKDHMPDANISAYRFAGLSSGDEEFYNYYNKVLGTTTYSIWNENDVAPHLFQLDMLLKLKHIYPELKPDPTEMMQRDLFNLVDDIFIKWSSENNYKQFLLSGGDGQPNSFLCPIFTGSDSFFDQIVHQHVPAYAYHMKIVDGFLTQATSILNNLGHGTLIPEDQGPYFTDGQPDPFND